MSKWCLFPEVVERKLTIHEVLAQGLDRSLRWKTITYCWLWMAFEDEPTILYDADDAENM